MRELIAIVLSLLIAIAAAGVIWGWWRSPIPTFMVFTPVLHGMLLGVGLMWVVHRVAIRSRAMRLSIGVLAGVVSIAALAFGHYAADAYAHRDQTQRAAGNFVRLPDAPHQVLRNYDTHLLAPATGRTGVIGHVVLQNRRPAWRRWVRGIEAVLVIGIAAALCSRAGDKPTAAVD